MQTRFAMRCVQGDWLSKFTFATKKECQEQISLVKNGNSCSYDHEVVEVAVTADNTTLWEVK